MKIKNQLILLALASGALASQAGFANITVRAPASLNTDFCNSLTGTWKGGGDIKASYVSCTYSGTAIVVPGYAATNPLNISMDMHLQDGPELCPEHAVMSLPATCNNNALTVDTDNAEMNGAVDNTGKAVNMQGTVFLDVGGQRVEAEIKNVHLVKQ